MSFAVRSVSDYDTFLVLDIGSFRTKVLACRVDNGDMKIEGHASMRESRKNILGGEIADLHGVSRTAMKAITQACTKLDSIPKDIIVAISSQHILYDTINMNYVRENPELPITMAEMDTVIRRVEHTSLERIASKIYQRLNIIGTEMKLVTTAITAITLDGQRVTNPVGFPGTNIKLHLMNVFMPISLYHSLRSIVRGLNYDILSIVPIGISLPKLAEETEYSLDANIFVDFGYSRTTVVIENDGETLGINTLPFGFSMIEETLGHKYNLEYLEIENILAHQDKFYKKYKAAFDTFYEILFRGIVTAGRDIVPSLFVRNLCLTGGPASLFLGTKFQTFCVDNHVGSTCSVHILPEFCVDFTGTAAPSVYGSVASLARIGQEACMLTRDPIAKILRYVVYRYE